MVERFYAITWNTIMSLLDENLQQHFAAIVEGSNDAIVAKDLNSIILSWNPAAERMFGYAAEEMVGRPITLLIPDDRQHEEVDFIDRLRRGERIQHFETVRKKKNGELFPISVSISPRPIAPTELTAVWR